ncbi:uncharacterized protein [Narcine bancroftii]|uniref:uncharacterized protein n=1 Tax=Narcine bancroftii TaxID=1343680 RepID=UPI003831171B
MVVREVVWTQVEHLLQTQGLKSHNACRILTSLSLPKLSKGACCDPSPTRLNHHFPRPCAPTAPPQALSLCACAPTARPPALSLCACVARQLSLPACTCALGRRAPTPLRPTAPAPTGPLFRLPPRRALAHSAPAGRLPPLVLPALFPADCSTPARRRLAGQPSFPPPPPHLPEMHVSRGVRNKVCRCCDCHKNTQKCWWNSTSLAVPRGGIADIWELHDI